MQAHPKWSEGPGAALCGRARLLCGESGLPASVRVRAPPLVYGRDGLWVYSGTQGNICSNGSSCCCHGSDSQRIPKLFPSFLPFFRNHSQCPTPSHARAEVHLAACSPVQPEPCLGSQSLDFPNQLSYMSGKQVPSQTHSQRCEAQCPKAAVFSEEKNWDLLSGDPDSFEPPASCILKPREEIRFGGL